MNFRHTLPSDSAELGKLISEEPLHAGRSVPEFWLPQTNAEGKAVSGVKCYAIEDTKGAAAYFRIENVLRFHLQLRQGEPIRTAKALTFLLAKIEHESKGYFQLIGATDAKPLRTFLMKLGFSESPYEMTKSLRTK